MAKALEMWPLHVIEEALGTMRMVSCRRRPERGAARAAAAASHRYAGISARTSKETTVSGVLARELDGIASAHIEELSAALPGFAEAMAWPAG